MGSASSSWSKGVAAAGSADAGVSPTTSHGVRGVRSGEQLVVHDEVVGVAEPVGGDDDVGLDRPEDVVDLLGAVEVDDRDDDRAQVGRAQNVMPASTQLGSWNITTPPGPTPRACSDVASDRAARSTSPKVPPTAAPPT